MKQDNDGLEVNIGSKADIDDVKRLTDIFKKFGSVSKPVIAFLKKLTNNTSSTVEKLNDVSKAAEEAHKSLSKSPKMSYSDTWKQVDKLKSEYNELKKTVDLYNKTYPKGLAGEKYRNEPISKNMTGKEIVAPNMDVAEAKLVTLKKRIEDGENTLKKLREEAKKPVDLDIKPAEDDIKKLNKDLDSPIDKLKKMKNRFNIFGGLKNVLSKTFGIFPKLGNEVEKASDRMFNKFKKLGLGLVGVRTAMSVLTKAVGAYLSFDGALQDSVTNSWNMLGSLLAPAIELVASLFATATNYIYNFVKALTGIDLVARANAKSLKTQAAATKAAGQAQRSLSSMDEITNLQTDSAGGGGAEAPQIKTMDIDTSWIDTIAEEIKKIAEILFDPIKKAWDKVGSQVIASAKRALGSMWELMKAIGKSFAEVWTNGTGERIMTNIFLILRNIFDIIGNIADRFREAWESGNTGTNIIQNLANALNDVLELIEHVTLAIADWWKTDDASLFSESILNIFETLSGWVEYITDKLVELWDNGLKKIMDGVNSLGTGVVALLDPILKDLDPIVKFTIDLAEKIAEIASSTIGSVLKAIGDALKWIASNEIALSILEGLALAIAGAVVAMNAWNIATGIFNVVTGIAAVVGGAFGAVMAIITSPITLIVIGVGLLIGLIILLVKHFDEVKVAVGAAIEGIKGFFEGVLDFFKGIIQWFTDLVDTVFSFFKDNWQGILLFIINPFAGAFKLLYDNFEGFRNFVDGIVSGIADFFSNLWNGITTGASKAWEGIKNAFNSIKSFFTGIINTIMGMFKTIGTSVGNVVAGAFKGVVNGILKAIENILNTPIKAINGLIKIINKVPGINLGKLNTFNLPRLATGTNNIEQEGIYHLHEGEAVVPKKYNPATGGYDNGADNRQIIELLVDLNANMLALSEREMAVYMDSRKVAEGIYDDMQTVTRNKNVSGVMKRS